MITIVKHRLNNKISNKIKLMLEIVIPAAFIPLILLIIWIRNLENYNKQPWASIIIVFIWSSTVVIGMSFVLNNFISANISSFLFLSVISAPIIEETIKFTGLRIVKKNILEIEDGLIYGAVIGFGFAASENLFYGLIYSKESLIVILSLFYLRILGSSLLHATATAIAGYGYANKIIYKLSYIKIIPYLILAIGIHSCYNLFAYSAIEIHQIIGVVSAVMFAFILFIWLKIKIVKLDNKKTKKVKKSFIKSFKLN